MEIGSILVPNVTGIVHTMRVCVCDLHLTLLRLELNTIINMSFI